MNKDTYISELERLLKLNNINNMYSILREYSLKIDDYIEANLTYDEIVAELGTPEDIVKKLVKENIQNNDNQENIDEEIKYDNDPEEVFENDNSNHSNPQFKDSFINKHINRPNENNEKNDKDEESNKTSYDNQFKDSWFKTNNLNSILQIVVVVLIVLAFLQLGGQFLHFGMRTGLAIFSIIPSILFVILVIFLIIFIVTKSKK